MVLLHTVTVTCISDNRDCSDRVRDVWVLSTQGEHVSIWSPNAPQFQGNQGLGGNSQSWPGLSASGTALVKG